MKFSVEILAEAKTEIADLESYQQELLRKDYKTIEEDGIEFVRVKHIKSKLFEIKTNEIRSLFTYREGRLIVIGVVFVKKTQKTPPAMIKLGKHRLKRN